MNARARRRLSFYANVAGLIGFLTGASGIVIATRSWDAVRRIWGLVQETRGELKETREHLQQARKDLKALSSCNDVAVSIDRPQNGQKVPESMTALGEASVNPACRFLFLIVKSRQPDGRGQFRVADAVQVQTDGHWQARLTFDDVLAGQEAEIEARVTTQPDSYDVHDRFLLPPEQGARSNTVHVTRAGDG